MDGSINAHAPTVAQRYGARYQKALGQERSSNSETLFDQLLSIPVTPQIDAQDNASEVTAEGEDLPTISATSEERDEPDEPVEESAIDDEQDSSSQSIHSVELAQQLFQPQVEPVVDESPNSSAAEGEPAELVQPTQTIAKFEPSTHSAQPVQTIKQQLAPDSPSLQDTQQPLEASTAQLDQSSATAVIVESETKVASTQDSAVPIESTEFSTTTESAIVAEKDHEQLGRHSKQQNDDLPLLSTAQNQSDQPVATVTLSPAAEDSIPHVSADTQDKFASTESIEKPTDRRQKWFEHPHGAGASESQNSHDSNAGDSSANPPVSLDFSLEPQSSGEFSGTSAHAEVKSETLTTSLTESLPFSNSTTEAIPFAAIPSAQSLSQSDNSINRSLTTESIRPAEANSIGTLTPGTNTRSSNDHEARVGETPTQPIELSQQERIRLVQRVARSFTRMGPDGGQISLRLHPPELGALSVSVRIEGKSMSAHMQTESVAAREVILESLPQLRQRLSEQGFDVQQIQVELAGPQSDNASGSFDPSLGQRSSDQPNQNHNPYQIDYRRLALGSEQPTPRTPPPNQLVTRTLSRSLDLQV